MKEKRLEIKDILQWILDHTEDVEAMNKISSLVFPYTNKYKQYYGKNKDEIGRQSY